MERMNFSFSKIWVAAACVAGFWAGPLSAAEDVSIAQGEVSRVNAGFDPLADIGELPEATAAPDSDAASVQPASVAPAAETAKPVPAKPETHRAFLFDYELSGFSQRDYAAAVADLFSAYEKNTGRKLVPAEKKIVALKIYTASGKGLSTPVALTRAVRDELVRRGFARENVLLVDLSEKALRRAGYLPPFRRGENEWEGSPVVALDTGDFYNAKWFIENPLPSREAYNMTTSTKWDEPQNDRKSFLPIPLLFDVDFWINLPVATDSPALGVSGALANATLWGVSNQRRFLDNPANAAALAVGVATIPEFKAKFELTLLSLEKFQFIGAPKFYAEYTASEKRLWLSANPVILDYLLWLRMNACRSRRGFEPILPEPPVFAMASRGSVSLGSCVSSEITLVELPAKDEK